MTPKPCLIVNEVRHSYGSKTALDGISFSVSAGQFCALLGPNGAGKSTLFSLLTRLFVAKEGNISIAGFSLAENPRNALAKMGVVFQQPTLDLDLTVAQNMAYYAALHGLSRKVFKERSEAALSQLDMIERMHEKVRTLNGGHRRRMEIARALLHQPDVLLLDEPTVGLDAATRNSITGHVHALAKNEKICVLWATHLVDEVDDDDQLVVLHQGRIVADGLSKDVRGKQTLADCFAELTNSEAKK